MMLCNRKKTKSLFAAVVIFFGLLIPASVLAGSAPVVTVGDSSSGGAINFEPPISSSGGDTGSIVGDIGSGGSSSIEISPGVTVTVTSLEAAVNSGSLGQDQVTNGFGSGGTAVTLSPQVMEKVQNAAATPSVTVDGESMTPLDALLTLSTSADLGGMSVQMPNGEVIDLSSSISNVTAALTNGNSTLVGTALNDAAIAISQLLRSGENMPDLKSASDAVADLLDAARAVPQLSRAD